MKKSKTQFGAEVEQTVAQYLTNCGWQILERNWRSGHREIDLIARDGRALVFVEVKGARSLSFGQPEERVDFAKRRHLNDAALAYLQAHEPEASEYRWDVVTVTFAKGAPTINHLRNAFTAD